MNNEGLSALQKNLDRQARSLGARFFGVADLSVSYGSKHITDSFTFFQTPEGFILPNNKLGELVVEFVDGEQAEELERFMEQQRQIEDQKAQERKARRTEINRKIAGRKKKKKDLGGL